jgi:malonyl CoA-acyl carrier protein transacylase
MGDTGARSAFSQGDARQRRAGRRSREAARRARRVEFSLTDEEFGELGAAAARAGLSRGAYAAEAALAAARGGPGRMGVPLREALVELMSTAGLVRRAGTNLNQAVARLNATGQRGEDLVPATQFCLRVIRRLDEAAEHLRRSIP